MNKAYLLIGGNMRDREKNLAAARAGIAGYAKIISVSGIYETAAWGKTDQDRFLNQAIEIETRYTASVLLKKMLGIETKMGRKREQKFGPRVIDIDIIFYNDSIIHKPGLTIPHPQLQYRRFVLVPLHDIAPGYVHPVLQTTVSSLLEQCNDPLDVTRL